MAWDCPSKKTRTCCVKIEDDKQKIVKELTAWLMKDIIMHATKFSEDKRDMFIQGLQDDEDMTDDPGFLEAWADWP